MDLNNLIQDLSDWDYLFEAKGISDTGYIAGTGYINGQAHAFLLTEIKQVPEPETFLLFILGLIVIFLKLHHPSHTC